MAEGEHDFGIASRGAKGFFAQTDADEGCLVEVAAKGIGLAIETDELLDDFGHGESGVESFFGSGGVGGTACEVVNDP